MDESPDTPQVSPGRDAAPGGAHGLGPHVVGKRVVVRRVLPGETGPSGGPAMTDLLGDCLSWGGGLCEVRTAEGTVVSVLISDIVSGKPVPPRPSVRLRVPPQTVHRHTLSLFDTLTTEEVGEWLLRTGGLGLDGRATKRGHSALAIGDPGLPLAAAADRVRAHYTARALLPLAQVVAGSAEEAGLRTLGWRAAGGHAEVLVAPTSRVLRKLPAPPAVVHLEVSPDGSLAVATVGEGARVRVALSDDWAYVGDLWVVESRRRSGLARAVLAEALDWAASCGATTTHSAVEVDNPAALQLHRTLGFSTHHEYRFLAGDREVGQSPPPPLQTTVSDGV